MLELTSQILGANPDFATLWNCRREVLQQLETQKYVVGQVPALVLPGCRTGGGTGGHRDRMVGAQVQVGREKMQFGVERL